MRAGYKSMLTEMERLYQAFEPVKLQRRIYAGEAKAELVESTGHWSYYAGAVGLALLIVHDEGVEFGQTPGRVQLPSMLINMDELFEAYVRSVLQSRLGQVGYNVLDGNSSPPIGAKKNLFDNGVRIPVTPDAVIKTSVGEVRTVVEVKYKTVTKTLRREDLSQALTYALSFGAPAGVLVHAAKSPSPTQFLGEVGGIMMFQHGLNLGADLEHEEAVLATALRNVCEIMPGQAAPFS